MAKRFQITTVIAAVLMLLVAACGGGDSADDTGTAADETTGSEDTQSGGNDAESDDGDDVASGSLNRDAVLRYGFYIDLSSMDPHRSTGSQDNTWLFTVYDRLINATPGAEPMPGLAESWEFLEDGKVFQLNLRQGVTFHDGAPFNAEAVRLNIERAKTVEGATLASLLSNVERVEEVDEYTVQMFLTAPDASLPLVLTDRPGAMISPTAFDNPDLDLIGVGAGMYRVVSNSPGDRVVYERFEDYWDVENVNLAGIEIVHLNDAATRLNALISGQIDAAEIETSQIEDAERAGLNTKFGEDVSFGLLQLNSVNRPEFADERVRRAINHAIDREAITEGIFFGYATPAVEPVPEGYFANNPDIGTDYFPYDPDLARELLAEAGYPDGFSFEILTTTVPQRVQTSEAIQSMLADVGITTTIRPIAGAGPFLETIYGRKEGDAWMLAWGGRPDPLITMASLYTPGQYNNPSGLTSPRVEELAAQARSTFDQAERAQVLQELSGAIVEDVLDVVVLYAPQKVAAYRDGVEGIEMYFAGRPELRGVGLTD